jgi:SpoVK/Ycf46/Vps4 family AAA+-type ATPase
MDDNALTVEDIPRTARTKYELLNRDGVVHYEHDTAQFSDVGGLENLKRWLQQRRPVFLGEVAGLDAPKGILLLGVQGGGKSLAAKAVAGTWHVPLLRLDFGALYDKYYGETERKTRESLAMAEMMAPCVLWFDEIEKGIATRDSDSGTAHRVLGTLLTWMAERKTKVFVVATANDISTLPPELLRKGRMDEVFFVDLPEKATRREILTIHLRKRGLDPASFDLDELAEATEGFSGSELEQAVVSGLYSTVGGSGHLDDRTLLGEIRATRPLSILMGEQIGAMRRWAEQRTVRA